MQDGAAFGGGALAVDAGEGVGVGAGPRAGAGRGRRRRARGPQRRPASAKRSSQAEMGPWLPGWPAASSSARSSQARAVRVELGVQAAAQVGAGPRLGWRGGPSRQRGVRRWFTGCSSGGGARRSGSSGRRRSARDVASVLGLGRRSVAVTCGRSGLRDRGHRLPCRNGGIARRVGAGVGVAGQFDDDQALVAGGGQGVEDGREVDLSVAEGEMLVDAAAHVLDLDVAQPGRGGADAVGGREGFEALAVADVEGETEGVGAAEGSAEPVEVGEGRRGDDRVRVRWRAGCRRRWRRRGRGSRASARRFQAVSSSVSWRGDAAEAVHGVGAEVGGDPHGPEQQVERGGRGASGSGSSSVGRACGAGRGRSGRRSRR